MMLYQFRALMLYEAILGKELIVQKDWEYDLNLNVIVSNLNI